MSTEISFEVFGTEFCHVLDAVRLFQASPKHFDTYAAVRCLSRHDGLSMVALNGASAAMGNVPTRAAVGFGAFSIPYAHVKDILSLFQKPLPKGVAADEYLLQVEVSPRETTITDVSGLFAGSALTVEIGEDPYTLERGEKSSVDQVRAAFVAVQRGLDPAPPSELTEGVHFSAEQVGLIARAAKGLGLELHLRMIGQVLVAPLSDDFVAYTASSQHKEDEDHRPPWIDERALKSWRHRLEEFIDEGVL